MKQILVLYGTQEGNAQEISKGIHQDAIKKGYQSKWHSFEDFRKLKLIENWPKDYPTIIVTSSTGNGDPPENVTAFWRAIRKGSPDLNNLHFTLLGLGDTNYDTYQGFPKALHSRLVELGAKEFYYRGEADDAVGLEEVVEPWIANLWAKLDDIIKKTDNKEEPKELTEKPPVSPGQPQTSETPNGTPTTPKSPTQTDETPKKKFVYKKPAGTPSATNKLATEPPLPQSVSKIIFLDKEPVEQEKKTIEKFSKDFPFEATVTEVKRLTSPEALKEVIHMELDITKSGMQFHPGDSFGIIPPNSSVIVNDLIEALGITYADVKFTIEPKEGNQDLLPKHIKVPCTIREALTYYCDITSLPSKRLLRLLAEYSEGASKERLLHLCSATPEGRKMYSEEIDVGIPNLLHLIKQYSVKSVPISHLFDVLPAQLPRYYSIANSLKTCPNAIHFAFTVVKKNISEPSPYAREFKGLCSHWLKSLAIKNNLLEPLDDDTPKSEEGIFSWITSAMSSLTLYPGTSKAESLTLPIFPRTIENSFILPEDLKTPIIMVGPGTGVAPFRGFLMERTERLKKNNNNGEVGEAWLFFGCRHPEKDFIYKEDLLTFHKSGVLAHLITAFSRETNVVTYVQHRLEEHGECLLELMLKKNGIFYVCGDARGMSVDVRKAWFNILKKYGNLDDKAAEETIKGWSLSRRYLLDVWS